MRVQKLACRSCSRITDKDARVCPVCAASALTPEWSGYVFISEPEQSETADMMEVNEAGPYAVKVR